MHLQLRSDHDDGTGRVVDPLSEEVLAEASLLALEAVGKGLERPVGFALDCADLLGVVEEGVNGFLKHSFLVAQDDFRCIDLDELLQAVVADDDPPVQVVEVGCSKASSIEGNERTEIGRNH